MNPLLAAVLLLSTSLAAGGQLLFRHGARGRTELVDFVGWAVAGPPSGSHDAAVRAFGLACDVQMVQLKKGPDIV